MTKTNMLFGAGIPTKPDVESIIKETGDLKEGQVVEYSLLSKVIGQPRHSDRWRSVIGAWKSRLFREFNVVVEAVPNVGYRVLPPSERVDYSGRKVKQGFRRIRNGAVVARQTRRKGLTIDAVKALDHIGMLDATLKLAERTQAKEMALPESMKGEEN